jgi:zinc transporter ZupT
MIYYLLPILAVAIGAVLVLLLKPSNHRNLKLLLAFSGAFLLAVTVFDLLPRVFKDQGPNIGLFIMLGILLQICLEFFSKGAEHGHLHLNKANTLFPWLLFFSLCVHALLEGFPVHGNDKLLYGIIVHKVPIAFIITSFFFNSQLPSWKATLFLLLFAIMTPIGSYLSENLTWLASYYYEITAIVIGIFLHISTTILFESSEGHNFNLRKLLIIVVAIAIAYVI